MGLDSPCPPCPVALGIQGPKTYLDLICHIYETLLERLSQEASFKFHFRLVTDTVHYYYLLIARNGNADDYRDFVIAVACEDNDVTARKIYENQLHSLLASITHAAGCFHLDFTDDKILKIEGTSALAYKMDANASIDHFIAETAAQSFQQPSGSNPLR